VRGRSQPRTHPPVGMRKWPGKPAPRTRWTCRARGNIVATLRSSDASDASAKPRKMEDLDTLERMYPA